jgi:WD40 repeat protein
VRNNASSCKGAALHIFISFASKDRDVVRRFVAVLCNRKPEVSCFFDERNLYGGVYWIPKLGDELRRADVVLLVIGSRIGPWQELEYYEALQLSRQTQGRPRIIPIVITDSPAPGLAFLSTLHHIFANDLTSAIAISAVDRAIGEVPTGVTVEPWKQFQPYKGLPALASTDAAFFFGRERETAEILTLLARARGRITTLVGQSGVGKSSLVMAGVMSRLRSQLWPTGDGTWPTGLKDSRSFLQFTLRPGPDPVKELAVCLVKLYRTDDLSEIEREASGWATRFREGSRLQDMLRLTREKIAEAQGGYPPKRFVLYVDQGEELYTRVKKKDEAQLFSRLLADAATDDETFSVLVSLRSDFYSDFQNDDAIFTLSTVFNVLPLNRNGLLDAIRKPAETLGVRFEDANMPSLIAEATRDSGALPLLSDLLQEMWLSMLSRADGVLRWSDQPGIVDIGLSLRRRADAFLELATTDADVVRRLFTLRLAQVAQVGNPVRRRAEKSECAADEWVIAEQLAGPEQRLLTISSALLGGEPIVEVAHEQLLQSWPTLKSWLDDQRDFLIWRTETEVAAKAYRVLPDNQKPEALLMGLALRRAETWFEQREADLAPDLRQYVKASLDHHQELIDNEAKREAERLQIQVRLRDSELEQERLARATAERAGELERFRAEAAEQKQEDAEDLAAARSKLAIVAAAGLIGSLALVVALYWFYQTAEVSRHSAEISRNETAVAFRISKTLSEGDTPAAARLALNAFQSAPTPASRAALFEAALEISPYLERRIHLDYSLRALEWIDAQTLSIGDNTGQIHFLHFPSPFSGPTYRSVAVPKYAAQGEEEYTSILEMKALSSGLLVVALNNGVISVINKDPAVVASYKAKLSDDYVPIARIADAGQNTIIAVFGEANGFRPIKCKINLEASALSCEEATTISVGMVTSFATDRFAQTYYIARPKESTAGNTTTEIAAYDRLGKLVFDPLPFEGVVQNLSLSSDGNTLAFTWQKRLRLLNVRTRQLLSSSDLPDRRDVGGLVTNAWSPTRSELPVSCASYSICILRINQTSSEFRVAEEFRGHRAALTHLAWQPAGRRLATRDASNELLIWSFEQSTEVYRNPVDVVENRFWTTASLSPDRSLLALGPSGDNQIGLLSISGTEAKRPNYLATNAAVQAIAITPERIYVALPGEVRFRLRNQNQSFDSVQSQPNERGDAPRLVWSGRGDEVLVGYPDQIAAADSSGVALFETPQQSHGLYGLAADPKHNLVLASYRDGSIVVFGLADRKVHTVLRSATAANKAGAEGSGSLSVDEVHGLAALSGNSNCVDLYQLTRLANAGSLTAQLGEIVSVAFSPSGRKLGALDGVGGLTLWEIDEGNAKLSLETRALPLPLMRHIREGEGQPPNVLFWSDDDHIVVLGGSAPPEIMSMDEHDWAHRIKALGYD